MSDNEKLIEEMKTWDRDVPYDVANEGDHIVAYEGESDDELRELYGGKPPEAEAAAD